MNVGCAVLVEVFTREPNNRVHPIANCQGRRSASLSEGGAGDEQQVPSGHGFGSRIF